MSNDEAQSRLGDYLSHMLEAARLAREYLQNVSRDIVLDPAIAHGKPVIRGTRLPVTVVVGSLAGGMTFEEVQREYGNTTSPPTTSGLRSSSWPNWRRRNRFTRYPLPDLSMRF